MSLFDALVGADRRLAKSRADASALSQAISGVNLPGGPGRSIVSTTFSSVMSATDVEAALLHDWRARREIEQPAGDLVRRGFEVEGLSDSIDRKALRSAIEGEHVGGERVGGLLPALRELWAEGSAFGGSVLLPVLDDGLPASEPLDLANLRRVVSWEVLDRYSIMPHRAGGPGSPVDFWLLTGDAHTAIERGQVIHPSRVAAVHRGLWMPRRWRDRNNGWGASRLEVLVEIRHALAQGKSHIGRMIERASQDVMALAELSEMLGEMGTSVVTDRLQVMMQSLHAMGIAVIDGGLAAARGPDGEAGRNADSYQVMERPLSGANLVLEAFHDEWRRGWSAPKVVADGEVAGGLNSGDDAGAWRAWAGWIEAEQNAVLTPWASWCMHLLFSASEGPTGGRVPEEWEITWNPIADPDPREEAEIGEIVARTDRTYIDMQAATPEQVGEFRLVEGNRGQLAIERVETLPEATPEEIAEQMLAEREAEAAQLEGGEPVQAQVLNGGQITALTGLAVAVAAGDLPAEVGTWLVSLAVPSLDPGAAASMLAVAESFEPAKPEPVPPALAQANAEAPEDDDDELPERAIDAARAFADAFALDLARSRADSAGVQRWRDALTRTDASEYPNAGVFVRIPDALARQFPYKPEDDSPPHVTVLFVGPTPWGEAIEEVRKASAQLAVDLLPTRARFGDLDYFETEQGRVAWVGVEFDGPVAEYHDALRRELMQRGVMVRHRAGAWVAHATLAYLGPGEEFAGIVPAGEWEVGAFEVWHGDNR